MAVTLESPAGAYRPLTVFRAKGSPRDVGEQLGSRFTKEAHRAVEIFKKELSWETAATMDGAKRYARKVLPKIEAWFPDFIEEMRGYAKGSGVPFDVLSAQWSGYWPAMGLKGCTDVAVGPERTADGSVLVAHNEDYTPDYDGIVVPVHVAIEGKPAFFAMSYEGLFPTMGFNAAGISLTGNAVSQNDLRAGIPKMVPPRKVLECRTLVDALRASMPADRGSSFNNIVCSREGELYSMEGSATAFEAIYGEGGWLVHTNHYLAEKMWSFEREPQGTMCSIARYNRARKLLGADLGRVTPDAIMKIQRDHASKPDSICRHENASEPKSDRVKTLFGSIVNLTAGEVYISGSTPCATEYRTYRLGA
ncbi:MAG TPA: C45 family peptidase [Thermoplasmata archaeon]|nr:C45 family peptidase [Thermoplasmata archaeon]